MKEKLKNSANAYDKCLLCDKLGKSCDGPNTLSMTLERWAEWCRDLKHLRGLTIEDIAAGTGYSESTIQRLLSGQNAKDIKRSTASDITKFLVGSSGKWPCDSSADGNRSELQEELEKALREVEEVKAALDGIHAAYQLELDTVRAGEQRKIAHLHEEIAYLKSENEKKAKIISRLLDD